MLTLAYDSCTIAAMLPNVKKIPKESTIEGLIEDLDQRGLLVFLVLLGQQAMKVLSETTVVNSKILVPKDNILVSK
jgi:hypothetical protein